MDQVLTFGEVEIRQVAPALFMSTLDRVVAGTALRVKPDSSRIVEQLASFQGGAFIGRQLDLTVAGDELFLIVFGSGIRGFTGSVTATLNGLPLPVLAAQAQGEFDGLDQVNLGPAASDSARYYCRHAGFDRRRGRRPAGNCPRQQRAAIAGRHASFVESECLRLAGCSE